jgi:hypothetical protein
LLYRFWIKALHRNFRDWDRGVWLSHLLFKAELEKTNRVQEILSGHVEIYNSILNLGSNHIYSLYQLSHSRLIFLFIDQLTQKICYGPRPQEIWHHWSSDLKAYSVVSISALNPDYTFECWSDTKNFCINHPRLFHKINQNLLASSFEWGFDNIKFGNQWISNML